MKINLIILLNIFTLTTYASTNRPAITSENWGIVDSKPVYLYTLTNSNDVTAKITNYGGIVVEFHTPDRNNKMDNIVLGLGSLDEYLAGHPAMGCIVGRFANRIAGAKFSIDNIEYTLTANSGVNHIHGGRRNFYTKVWDATTSSDEKSVTLSLAYFSADLEEGYPGNLKVKVDYVLNNDNELQIHYKATTDKPTVVNLTNHSYFNLSGCKEDVRGHQVRIYADNYTPMGPGNIPTGEIAPVKGTPYDLRQWTTINDRMTDLPRGFDDNFCVGGTQANPVLVAELYEPKSGRLLQTFTTEPGIVFYTAAGLNGRNKNPQGVAYTSFMGACFEAQHYPDSPNKPNFPTTVLRPGETYKQVTIYKVGIMNKWAKYENNPVLGGRELGTIFDIFILKDGKEYIMYSSWRPKRSVAVSRSSDGMKWTNPEIVLGPNDNTDWEDDINRPAVLIKDGKYHMWYTGQYKGKNSWIGYATSKDGKNFVRQSNKPVVSPSEPWEKVAVMCPHVMWDEKEKIFKMWYSGGEQYEPDAIGYATSKDGLHWEKHPQPVFVADPSKEWEQHKVTACQVIKRENDYLMFYIGFLNIDFAQIGMARSKNGINNWERYEGNPIISPTKGSWDADACYKPFVIQEENRWMLWYNGRDRSVEQIGLAIHKGVDLDF